MRPHRPVAPLLDPAVPRRAVLRPGRSGLFGLGLPGLFGARPPASPPRGRARACIVLFMWGGPAQQETWDLKPDAPEQVPRGVPADRHRRPRGLRICEHFPLLARRAGRLARRPVGRPRRRQPHDRHPRAADRPARPARRRPALGRLAALRGRAGPARPRSRAPLPPFVSMWPMVPNGAPRFVEQSHGQGAGWLGPRLNPLTIDDDAEPPRLPGRPSSPRGRRSRRPGRRPRAATPAGRRPGPAARPRRRPPGRWAPTTTGRYDLLADPAVAGAFDLDSGAPRLRDRYGCNPHGQTVLQARRLVEAGVPLVTVFWPNRPLK